LRRFWSTVVWPILETMEPDVVVEIGAGAGGHTRKLAKFCQATWATLHVVDPAPRFDPGAAFVFHRARSLDVLGNLGPVDVALVDGDHNWYTVFHELELLRRTAQAAGSLTPLVLCHDVCWPYGRRDMYHDPEVIPPSFRQPWERAGILPGSEALVADGGINPACANAVHEGGPRNGVMTAIEDFLEAADEPLEVTLLPVLHGLAIVAPRSRLDADPELESVIEHWHTADGLAAVASMAEVERLRLLVAHEDVKRSAATPPRDST
jgi:Methyltransferase domain